MERLGKSDADAQADYDAIRNAARLHAVNDDTKGIRAKVDASAQELEQYGATPGNLILSTGELIKLAKLELRPGAICGWTFGGRS